ncbi:hypothetical protein CLV24_10293 [Pontibacter ummariensis]|uniref:Uncharacterized protein n=1 Tax=Pontibacter ummariensis TaxID=1610492 RepID=A0A239C5F5_9BACT|nr:hypothetical protein [Pontibacter ummariensis]PRY15472.1 hypothetical protein CLV24_10293 [Pontibacter ummariensis]SNS14654.1 hypothetical protein SAMN06296052_102320 [Pontibacter ummariensis]
MSNNNKNKDIDKLKNEDVNKTINEGNSVPNIHPTAQKQEKVDEEELLKGKVGGAPSQKSGSRGSADVQDGGTDVGSSAGSH